MIQLRLTKSNELEISDRKSTIVLTSGKINLNDQSIDQPGEYEDGGVEVIYSTNAALIVWERLQLVYIFNPTAQPTAFEKEQFSSCDALLLSPSDAPLSRAKLTPIIDEYDPKLVVATLQTTFEDGYKESLKAQETNTLKLTVQTLPVEGRDFYLLG